MVLRPLQALGVLALLYAAAAASMAQTEPASAPVRERSSYPDPQQRLRGSELVQALREGGLVIYFRHAATDFSKNDQAMRDFDDCANQRPLTNEGRKDAKAIGQRIAALKLPIGSVKASPMCRTMEHARLMLSVATPTSTMREVTDGEYIGLKRLLSARVPAGINRWMVGHGTPFHAVAGPPHLAEGESVVLRPTGESWIVLARLTVADWFALR